MLREGLADSDVVSVLSQHLRDAEGETINRVDVSLDEQRTANLVRDGLAIGQFGRGSKPEQHRFFMIGAGSARNLFENLIPLIGALRIHTVKHFVQNRFND
jgi:hypothetical protein